MGDDSLKVAYLIVAHHQPEHLARLVHSLSADWNDIYIHIDRKVDLEAFVSCIDISDNPVFLNTEQRIDVRWGGVSVVEAIISLLSEAFESEQSYDRFCLLSGSDFPIKSLDEIKSVFASDIEFMRIDRCLIPDTNTTHSRYISYHYFTDSNSLQDRNLSGKIGRKPYAGINMYHGSAWWSLTRGCVEYIIDFLAINPDYTEFHRTTFCPDEIYFQSIVKNSHYAEMLSHNFETQGENSKACFFNEHGCHYIDWNAVSCSLPKILRIEDGCALKYSDMLFARKFDQQISLALLDKLDQTTKDSCENGDKKSVAIENNHKKSNIKEKVWLIGDGRSGTSWLADLINFDSSYQYLFEPVHPYRNPVMRDYGLFPFRHPDEQDVDLERVVKAIFSARVFTPDSRVAETQALCPEKLLVKDIFAHLMVKWAANKIDGLKIVVLVRHPFAVAVSKRKFSSAIWKTDVASLYEKKDLLIYLPDAVSESLEQLQSFFEIQVANWSVIHSVLFQQFQEDDYLLLFYENLCHHPERELARVMRFLGRDEQAVMKALTRIDNVSKFTTKDDFRKRGRKNVTAWIDELSEEDLEGGMRILRQFSLDKLYDNQQLPVEGAVSDFRKAMKVRWKQNSSLLGEIGNKIYLREGRIHCKQKYIFVVSHMRSYSSVLCHILGSNLDISGYAESNLSYSGNQQIQLLHESVRKMTEDPVLSTYVLDKLLHNNWKITNEMLSNSNFRFIFLLRQPEQAIRSILSMINNFSLDEKPNQEQIESAVCYYQLRLRQIIEMAGRVNGNAIFFSTDDLKTDIDQTLSILTNWLNLDYPLGRNYRIFSHTGLTGYGDTSKNIQQGKFFMEDKECMYSPVELPGLDECVDLYQHCYALLAQLNEGIEMLMNNTDNSYSF